MSGSSDGSTASVDVVAMGDLKTAWCLRVAVDLRLAEHLDDDVVDVGDLARRVGCDADALHGVLEHLSQKGVFEEPERGRFRANAAARQLATPEARAALGIEGIGLRMAAAWATLPSYVRSGRSAYHELFGRTFWEDVSADPELGAAFDAAMAAHHHDHDHDHDHGHRAGVPLRGGWDGVGTVVDVGGGSGSLLAAILREHPHLRGVLVDLEGPISRSAAVLDAAGVRDRVTVVAQSFFDPLPTGGDVYLLNGVIHDWGDDDAVAILRRCADAGRPNGRILIGDSFSDGPPPVRLDVSMILAGGRNRSIDQLRALAAAAGLDLVATEPLPECRPR